LIRIKAMAMPVDAIANAIAAKDAVQFARGFDRLTFARNACHQDMGRGFVGIRVAVASPFSDPLLAPKK
jgi:hypothetical protein